MSNRRRRSNSGHRARGPALAGDVVDQVLDDLFQRLQTCTAGPCLWPASRWYVRQDLTDARIVVVPVCWEHYGPADQLVCPGHGEGGCLSSPDDPHFTEEPRALIDVVATAFLAGLGIGLPFRDAWGRLDVIRPAAGAR